MANPYITFTAVTTLLLIAISVKASDTSIANGPIGSLRSIFPSDPSRSSKLSKLRAQIACTKRLAQMGGDAHCLAVLLNKKSPGKLTPDRDCCNAMADLDQEAPECWDYLIGTEFRYNQLLTMNELCVAGSLLD